jgi:two-component system KDP operon response regulator KdpE
MNEGERNAPCVLVVDDDEAVLRLLQASLRLLGCDVHLAADSEQGLKLALELQPQVILLDVRMPRLNGHAFLKRFKLFDIDTQVIVMSAFGTMDDVIMALRGGSIDYLRKPWDKSELETAVRRAIAINQARQQERAGPQRLRTPPPSPGTLASSVAPAAERARKTKH